MCINNMGKFEAKERKVGTWPTGAPAPTTVAHQFSNGYNFFVIYQIYAYNIFLKILFKYL